MNTPTLYDDHDRPCSEMRLLPIGGGGNIHVCRQSYEQEMKFRRERIAAGAHFELPAWEDLEMYTTAESK